MDFHSSSLNNGKAAIIQEDLASFWCNVDSGKEDVGQKAAKVKGSENPMMMGSASKRHRGSNQNSQISRCQVEGCNIDLSGAKDYHRRHRICECHSKSPKVIVAGLERRFCQQCSRFHSLVEFDEKKRSCRRRLSDHNARRRRQNPETAHLRTAGLTSSLCERRPSSFLVNRLASSLATTTNWESSCNSKMTMAESTLMRSSGHGSSSSSANSYRNEAQHFPVALSLLSSSSNNWELNQQKSSSLHNPILMHQNGSIGQPAIALDSQNWPLYSPQHVSAEQAHSISPL